MPDDIRQELAGALRAHHGEEAKWVSNAETEIEPYPAPFLKKYRIYKVLHYGPYQPIMFYVGYAPRGQAFMLSNHLENYAAMAKADGLTVDSAREAEDYATVGLDVTRSMSYLVYLVRSVDDLMFRGVLDEEDEQLIREAKERYASEIEPPKAERAGDGYRVTAYMARNRELQRHTVTVGRNGSLHDEVTTVARDLPLKMGGT